MRSANEAAKDVRTNNDTHEEDERKQTEEVANLIPSYPKRPPERT